MRPQTRRVVLVSVIVLLGLLVALAWVRRSRAGAAGNAASTESSTAARPKDGAGARPALAPDSALSGQALPMLNPQFEICLNPALATQSLAGLLAGGDERQRAYVDQQAQELRRAAISALLQSPDDERRMAGHLLNNDVAAAAQLAHGTSAALAYGMAWMACRNAARTAQLQELQHGPPTAPPLSPDALPMGLPEPNAVAGACADLRVERWAQLDPDNAAPWLELATEAQQRGDRAQAIDAIYHAGLARGLNSGWGWLPAMLANALPEQTLDGGRMQLMLDVTGEQSMMMDLTGVSGVASYCNAPGLADANTHQQCERIAQLMMSRSTNASERLIGVGLAERLGLPAGQMPVSRKEVSAALQAISDDFQAAMAQPQSCEGLRHINRWLADAARMGEWDAAARQQHRP